MKCLSVKNGLSKADKPNINNKNSIPQNKCKKTDFHNFYENFTDYDKYRLIEILRKSQEAKFGEATF